VVCLCFMTVIYLNLLTILLQWHSCVEVFFHINTPPFSSLVGFMVFLQSKCVRVWRSFLLPQVLGFSVDSSRFSIISWAWHWAHGLSADLRVMWFAKSCSQLMTSVGLWILPDTCTETSSGSSYRAVSKGPQIVETQWLPRWFICPILSMPWLWNWRGMCKSWLYFWRFCRWSSLISCIVLQVISGLIVIITFIYI